MYARLKREQAGHGQPSSSGRSSRAKRALRRLRRPSLVRALPVRAVRVGSTQSNMSTPRAIDLEHALRVADPHEVAGLLLRQEAAASVVASNIGLAVLPHAQPADRVTVEVERDELLRRAPAKLAVETALRDREAELPRRARQVALALGPGRRPAHRLLELGARNARGRADVEAHRDVRAEQLLDPRRRAPA